MSHDGTSSDAPASRPRLSVVIPALNEEAAIHLAIASAQRAGSVEVIVADGGSGDRTVAIAQAQGAVVVSSPRGRARQMNAGAAVARGAILLFLHADTLLPDGYDAMVRETLARPGTAAGAFRLGIAGASRSFRLIETLVQWRSTVFQLPFGDQALFTTAEAFRVVGGVPEIPIMEDVELVRRLRKRGSIRIASAAVQTSARRWVECGVWRMTLLNQLCLAAHRAGVSPERIAGWRKSGER
jgi:rSAM/selenodomain-associated transferase 2